MLSPAERRLLDGMALARRRREWLAGRVAAKRALGAAIRTAIGHAPAAAAISILGTRNGAPRFEVEGRPELSALWNISIAHDDALGVCALSSSRGSGIVGVDVERMRSLRLRLLRPVLTLRERRRLALAGGADAPPLIAIWAIKEAVLKATHGFGCESMGQVELAWRASNRVSARLLLDAGTGLRLSVGWRRWRRHVIAWASCRTGSEC